MREFLNTPAGRVVSILFGIGAAVACYMLLRNSMGAGEAEWTSLNRVFICSETGKTFNYEISAGDTIPVRSPHTGRPSGYPAEQCFWTTDGQIRKTPTYVLLNQYRQLPEPTFCPDCGRLVTAMNPPAIPGQPPPKTRNEIKPVTVGRE